MGGLRSFTKICAKVSFADEAPFCCNHSNLRICEHHSATSGIRLRRPRSARAATFHCCDLHIGAFDNKPLARQYFCILSVYKNIVEDALHRSTKESCLADIKRRILSTDLAPGVDLDEVSLCDQYGMSRTPLREVLQRLQGEGYVDLEQNRGAKVASMDVGVLRTFFQTAPMVYANIARLACENRTARQIDQLKQAQVDFTKAAKASHAGEAALANHQFHGLIGEMAQNPYLLASLARLQIDHTRLSQTFYRPAAPSETLLVLKAIEQHDAMISAIEAGEGSLAIDLTLQHWDLSRGRMERFVRPDHLPVDVISLKDRRNAF